MVHDKCATYIEHIRKFNDRSCNKKRNSKLTQDEQTSMKKMYFLVTYNKDNEQNDFIKLMNTPKNLLQGVIF